jgi:hypothetical protein
MRFGSTGLPFFSGLSQNAHRKRGSDCGLKLCCSSTTNCYHQTRDVTDRTKTGQRRNLTIIIAAAILVPPWRPQHIAGMNDAAEESDAVQNVGCRFQAIAGVFAEEQFSYSFIE